MCYTYIVKFNKKKEGIEMLFKVLKDLSREGTLRVKHGLPTTLEILETSRYVKCSEYEVKAVIPITDMFGELLNKKDINSVDIVLNNRYVVGKIDITNLLEKYVLVHKELYSEREVDGELKIEYDTEVLEGIANIVGNYAIKQAEKEGNYEIFDDLAKIGFGEEVEKGVEKIVDDVLVDIVNF